MAITSTTGFWYDFSTESVNPGTIMASFTDTVLCSTNLYFEVHPEECNGTPVSRIYFDAQFKQTQYNVDEELSENGFGESRVDRRVVKRRQRFDVVVDRYIKNFIYELCFGNKRIQAAATDISASTFEIFEIEIEEEELDDELALLTISFVSEDNVQVQTFGTNACCNDLFEDGPFEDPCLSELSPISGCGDAAISISEAGGILTATVTDFASPTIRWTLTDMNGNVTELAANAASVPLSTFGTYRAIITECGLYTDYPYLDSCANFSVQITQDTNQTLIAEVTEAPDTPTFTWYLWDGADWVETGDGSSILVIEEGGLYRVLVSASGCSVEDTFTAAYSDCDTEVSLSYSSGSIEATLTNPPASPTFTWYKDTGSGPVEYLAASGQDTIEPDGAGLYSVEVSDGAGCTAYGQLVHLGTCSLFDVLITALRPNTTYATLQASAIMPPDTTTFEWFQNTGSGYVQIGSGNTIDITSNGTVRVRATSGGCVSEDEFPFSVDPTTDDTYEKYKTLSSTDEFVVTEFALPNPGVLTANEISAELDVWVNQVHAVYDETGLLMNGYSIDFANNKIIFNKSWPTNSIFEARLRV